MIEKDLRVRRICHASYVFLTSIVPPYSACGC
jgi:hypothetical protein